jgi:hypothetical protein
MRHIADAGSNQHWMRHAEITRLIDIAAPTFTLWGIQS